MKSTENTYQLFWQFYQQVFLWCNSVLIGINVLSMTLVFFNFYFIFIFIVFNSDIRCKASKLFFYSVFCYFWLNSIWFKVIEITLVPTVKLVMPFVKGGGIYFYKSMGVCEHTKKAFFKIWRWTIPNNLDYGEVI